MLYITVIQNSEGEWFLKIEGMSRTSLTPCQTEGQARELMHLATMNTVLAERLHGLRD